MKIYEIGTGYAPIPAQMGAATEIVAEELTRSFLKEGADVEIIDIAADKRPQTDLPVTEVRVPKKFMGTDVSLGLMHKLKRVVYSVSLAKKIRKILKSAEGETVLHFHNQYNLFFVMKLVPKRLLKKATVAYTVHSYVWGTDWEKIKNTVKKKYFQEIYCVKHADLVFVLNDITAGHFVNRLGVPTEHIHRIKNGVNTEKYAPLDSETVDELKKHAGLSGKKVIFQVGSVCGRKNQLQSVRMLCAYLQTHPGTVYMYAGGVIDTAYQQEITDFAKENGIENQVKYAGELVPGTELNGYYNMADCCVFTSVMEAFSLVITEAISSGTYTVLRENLRFDINEGYSVYNSEEDFVREVDAALHGGKVPRENVKNVLEKYSWDAVAAELLHLFESRFKAGSSGRN